MLVVACGCRRSYMVPNNLQPSTPPLPTNRKSFFMNSFSVYRLQNKELMTFFPFLFFFQVLDEIGVDVASQVGVNCNSLYKRLFAVIIFLFIMLTRTIFGSCQRHQRVKSQGRIERTPAGIFLLWIFLIKQWKNSHKTNLPMAFKPRCTYWNKGMIQTADLGNDGL